MVILQIMDMLVEQTHDVRHQWRNNERGMRFTDTRLDEQQRGVSLKMVPMTLVMEGSSGKSHVMNLVDTPGACLWQVCLRRALVFAVLLTRSYISSSCNESLLMAIGLEADCSSDRRRWTCIRVVSEPHLRTGCRAYQLQ